MSERMHSRSTTLVAIGALVFEGALGAPQLFSR